MNGGTTASDPTPILTTLGDLNSPNWGDERDRLVHLEGAAVAQQVQMFIGLGIAAAMPWALGTTGIKWGVAVILAASFGTLSYARYISTRGVRGVSYFASGERARGLFILAAGTVFVLGALRSQVGGSTTAADAVITFLGVIAAVLGGATVGMLIAKTLKEPKRDVDVPDDVFTDD